MRRAQASDHAFLLSPVGHVDEMRAGRPEEPEIVWRLLRFGDYAELIGG